MWLLKRKVSHRYPGTTPNQMNNLHSCSDRHANQLIPCVLSLYSKGAVRNGKPKVSGLSAQSELCS
jgi:hypothetical protein